jgi:hypothetical protein
MIDGYSEHMVETWWSPRLFPHTFDHMPIARDAPLRTHAADVSAGIRHGPVLSDDIVSNDSLRRPWICIWHDQECMEPKYPQQRPTIAAVYSMWPGALFYVLKYEGACREGWTKVCDRELPPPQLPLHTCQTHLLSQQHTRTSHA